MNKLATVIIIFLLVGNILWPAISFAENSTQEALTVYLFHSPTCPHCIAEQGFLDDMEEKYSDIEVKRYEISDESHHDLLFSLAEKHHAEAFLGSVPMTFIGEDFFLGFDNKEGIGRKIEDSIKRQLDNINAGDSGKITTSTNGITNLNDKINLSIVGNIDPNNYSLPALTVVLGLLDGFNVCSLGALILILGLVISLRSRKKIIALGGIFIITTAVIYGLLIFLWHQLFSAFSSYVGIMEFIIGLIGVLGGAFFLREFRKMRKYGPHCETAGSKMVSKFSVRVKKAFKSKKGFVALSGIILLFAAVITIVEFPCSAAVPVVFAGILAEQGLSTAAYVGYITLFILFYMLDEIIIFLIAVWKMNIWTASPKFVVWATLIEGVLLFALGIYYLANIF